MTIKELAEQLGQTPSAISYHVKSHRDGVLKDHIKYVNSPQGKKIQDLDEFAVQFITGRVNPNNVETAYFGPEDIYDDVPRSSSSQQGRNEITPAESFYDKLKAEHKEELAIWMQKAEQAALESRELDKKLGIAEERLDHYSSENSRLESENADQKAVIKQQGDKIETQNEEIKELYNKLLEAPKTDEQAKKEIESLKAENEQMATDAEEKDESIQTLNDTVQDLTDTVQQLQQQLKLEQEKRAKEEEARKTLQEEANEEMNLGWFAWRRRMREKREKMS